MHRGRAQAPWRERWHRTIAAVGSIRRRPVAAAAHRLVEVGFVPTDTSRVTILPSALLFDAATKLRSAGQNIADAEAALQGTDDQAELELLHDELLDLNWRTQSLATKRQRDEKQKGQYKGPETPATDFPEYDAKSLKAAQDLLAREREDLAGEAASLPPAPTAPQGNRPSTLERPFNAMRRFLSRLGGSSAG